MSDSEPQTPPPAPPAPPSPEVPDASGGPKKKNLLRNPPRRPKVGAAEGARKARGIVCAQCGKYHDVSGRTEGQRFTCSKVCDAEIVVPGPPAPGGPAIPADQKLRATELRRTRRVSAISAVTGFGLAIVLCSAAMWVWWWEGKVTAGICAGVAGLGFLVSAAIATSEMRHASAELAGMGAEGRKNAE